jgi:hypothetical protein
MPSYTYSTYSTCNSYGIIFDTADSVSVLSETLQIQHQRCLRHRGFFKSGASLFTFFVEYVKPIYICQRIRFKSDFYFILEFTEIFKMSLIPQ